MIRRTAFLSAIILALAGCGSSQPIRLYQIAPVAASVPVSLSSAHVTMGDVTLPKTLDRLDMVRETSSTRVVLEPASKWVASLDEMTRAALVIDLQSRLAPGTLLRGDAVPDNSTYVIDVTIDQFGANTSGQVVLNAAWKAGQGDPEKIAARGYEHIAIDASAGDTDAMVATMNVALAQLADRIAAGVPAR